MKSKPRSSPESSGSLEKRDKPGGTCDVLSATQGSLLLTAVEGHPALRTHAQPLGADRTGVSAAGLGRLGAGGRRRESLHTCTLAR